jgi:hypothetical protein
MDEVVESSSEYFIPLKQVTADQGNNIDMVSDFTFIWYY